MKKFKIGVVEDEFLIAESIRIALQGLGYDVPETASNYEEAINMLANENPDLVLLDINLKDKMDGIDIAAFIQEKYQIPFIFLTANADTASVERAKKTKPSAYLLKPFQKEDLYTSIEIAMSNFDERQETTAVPNAKIIIKDALFIKEGYYFHKVLFSDILYLESDHVYVNVVCKERKFLVRTSMQSYLENFDPEMFFRIGRSHAINLNHINGINSAYVKVGDTQIPIVKKYRDDLMGKVKLG